MPLLVSIVALFYSFTLPLNRFYRWNLFDGEDIGIIGLTAIYNLDFKV